mgnify:CR=1 FL=1
MELQVITKKYIVNLLQAMRDAPSREEEIEAVGVEETIEKGMTVFPRNKDGQLSYGTTKLRIFKDACGP